MKIGICLNADLFGMMFRLFRINVFSLLHLEGNLNLLIDFYDLIGYSFFLINSIAQYYLQHVFKLYLIYDELIFQAIQLISLLLMKQKHLAVFSNLIYFYH